MLINLLCPIFHLDRQPIQLILVSSCFFVCFSDHEDAFNIPVSAGGNARLHLLPKTMAANASTSSGLHLLQSTLRSREVQTERKTPRTDYFHHGRQICMHTFCYMHAISRQRQDKWYCPPHPWVYKETACKCLVVWRHLICPELHYEFCRGPLGLFFLDARHMWGITMWNFCHIIRQLFTDITNISCRQKGHLRTEPSFVFGKPCVHLWRPWLQKQICVGRVNKA